jgi:hypothetical protein
LHRGQSRRAKKMVCREVVKISCAAQCGQVTL